MSYSGPKLIMGQVLLDWTGSLCFWASPWLFILIKDQSRFRVMNHNPIPVWNLGCAVVCCVPMKTNRRKGEELTLHEFLFLIFPQFSIGTGVLVIMMVFAYSIGCLGLAPIWQSLLVVPSYLVLRSYSFCEGKICSLFHNNS